MWQKRLKKSTRGKLLNINRDLVGLFACKGLTQAFEAWYKVKQKPAGLASIYKLEKGIHVNKSELIDQIAKAAGISKAAAGRSLDATTAAVTKALKKGDLVTLIGFGTFYVGKRAARNGRNPRTGATIKIKAANSPKFRAGKALKDAVN